MSDTSQKLKNIFNNSDEGSIHLKKTIKNSEPKSARRSHKIIIYFKEKNIKENSVNTFISNKGNISSNNKVNKIKKYLRKNSKRNKIEQNFKNNNFKTIKIRKKYKISYKNENALKDKNDDKLFKKKRPLSLDIKKRTKLSEKYQNNNHSNLMKFEKPKLFEESKIQYLNSDIIDLM